MRLWIGVKGEQASISVRSISLPPRGGCSPRGAQSDCCSRSAGQLCDGCAGTCC